MSYLDVALSTVRDRIARYQTQGIGEQDTKTTLIVPILRALGWDVEDLEDVKLEYRRRPSDNPVDYALFLLRTPRLFIEARSLGAHFSGLGRDPRRSIGQLHHCVISPIARGQPLVGRCGG